MICALDIGLKRIGVAFGYDGGIAVPQNAVLRKNRNQAARDISKVLRDNAVTTLVVGIPKGGGSEDEMTRRVRHFVGLLDFAGQVIYIDESFTSSDASALGIANSRKKDGKLDSLSAMIILQRYFESYK